MQWDQMKHVDCMDGVHVHVVNTVLGCSGRRIYSGTPPNTNYTPYSARSLARREFAWRV